MQLIQQAWAVLHKDVQLELRSKYALSTVLAFVGAALLVVLFSLKAEQLPPTPKSGLVWIIILFAALSSLSRSFVLETDRQTFDLLRLHGRSIPVFLGKLGYNFIFTLSVNVVTFVLYLFLLDMPIANAPALFITLLLGTLGLSGVSTMLAAIVSQADRRGPLFAVLSMPLLIPLILLLVRTTKGALIVGSMQAYWNDVAALVGYAGVTISAGIMLFEYIFED